MKIKKTSWHYQVASLTTNGQPSNSLCIYFWQVVGSVFVAIPLSILAILALIFLLTLPFTQYLFTSKPPLTVTVIIGAFEILLLADVLLSSMKKRRGMGMFKYLKHQAPTFSNDSPPSLFRSWLRAKKDKVCPLLEFE